MFSHGCPLIDDRLRSASDVYSVEAENLGLHVCGQGTGMQ